MIAELAPSGELEHDIVKEIARLAWRKQNLETLRVGEFAQRRRASIMTQHDPPVYPVIDLGLTGFLAGESKTEHEKRIRNRPDRIQAAEHEARTELGEDIYELTEVGEAATFNGLTKKLDIRERRRDC